MPANLAGMKPVNQSLRSSDSAARGRPEDTGTGRRKRRRWTADQKIALLAQFRESGLTAAEFGRRAGVSGSLLSTWSRRACARRAVSASPGFAQVRVDPVGAASMATAQVLVQFGADIKLSVAVGADPAWLGRVLRAACDSSC